MDANGKIKFGSTFKAESQDVAVNCDAEPVQDDLWKVGVFTVNFGETWYYAPLEHQVESADGTTRTERYLIEDNVGLDGWGEITIYRNIEWLNDDQPNVIPSQDKVPAW